MNELALFAGAGGGILGGMLLGWRTVCAVEIEPYPASVLCQRQNDGLLPPFPIWDDVRTFDGNPWRGIVDVVSGGFPCQDISAAGKGAGITGERSGLWKEYARIIGEVRPRYVLVENSSMLTLRGLGTVLGDLSTLGYDARWGVISAADAGAPHLRKRIWIVAYPKGAAARTGLDLRGREPDTRANGSDVPDSDGSRLEERERCAASERAYAESHRQDGWSIEPDVGRVAHGVAARVDRLKAIGNGQVPAVVRIAWNILNGREERKA